MPAPIDQGAVERAALALAEGDPTANWLKAQDTRATERTWMLVKIVMRAVALLVSVGLLVLTSMAGDILALPLGAMATVWNATEFITMGVRRDFRRGVTPKAHVGADLVLWVYAGYTFGNDCNSLNDQLGNIFTNSAYLATETAFACLLFIVHFVLFVRACVEVDRQKKSRRIQKLVLALQGRDRRGGAAPPPRDAGLAASETSLPPKGGAGAGTAAKSEASLFSHRAPPSSVGSPVAVDPRALNAKYDAEAMRLVRELDVLDAQKVLGNRRDVEH